MVQILKAVPKKPSFGQRLNEGLKKGLKEYDKYRKNEEERENQVLEDEYGIKARGLRGETRKLVIPELLKQGIKSQNTGHELLQNKKILSNMEQEFELEKGALDPYVKNPEFARKIYQPKQKTKTQASQPIDQEQLERINAITETDNFKNATPAQKTSLLHKGGVSKENASAVVNPFIEEEKINEKRQTREELAFDRSYTAQEPFMKEVTDKYKSFETEMKPRLLQMRNIPDEKLISPTGAVFLEQLGIPLGALEDPSSELYQKLSLDLLKGLPETYGNRILKVEVDNFLKTIPSLMNSPEGRRMIASNMLKLGEMKEVYYDAMRTKQREALDNRKPLAKDFQQDVFDQVKPQIDRINNEFVKMAEIKQVPPNTIPFFSPSGEIEFVPKEHAQWAQENGGRRIW